MVERGLAASVPQGLSIAAAAERLRIDGPNELPASAKRSLWRQTWDVVREPMLLLLVAAGTVNFLLAEPLDGATLAAFVIVVITISIYQERKTERAVLALRDLSAPRALVVRDGEQRRIPGREVVVGDALLLAEGDRVPADGIVLDSMNLSIDESTLTGEAVPVRKTVASAGATMGAPGGDASPWVFAGTLAVKGHAVVSVLGTGAGTELGRIGTALAGEGPGRTRLQHEIDRLVVVVGVVGLSVATAVVAIDGFLRGSWLDAVLAGIATAMAVLPEEFPVVLTVFLALGAWRMSQAKVLTRHPPALETLGSATVVCVDKTGTLTMNRMEVDCVILRDRSVRIGDGSLTDEFHPIVEFGLLASPIDPFDPVDRAFVELGRRELADTEHLHGDWSLVREYPLEDQLLALSHVWLSPDATQYVVAAKGAPEAIADLCHLSDDDTRSVLGQVTEATAQGARVLAVARASFDHDRELPRQQHDFEFEYLGLVGLHDPVRDGVADAVAECRRAGVRTVMITGDHPGTALAVARDAGMEGADSCLTGPELDALDEEGRVAAVARHRVFARMTPQHKLALVHALRAAGHVVVMTGDGVNDAPALRAADVGIAMGARGTDVAREAADLVITDDDFSSIVGGIRLGRGIFDNIRKAMAYIIAVHVPIIGMSLLPLFSRSWPLVLLPVQIAFLELIIDPSCSVVFEMEQVDPAIMQRPPRRLDRAMFGPAELVVAITQGLSTLAAVAAVYGWCVADHLPSDQVRSATFAALVLSNVALILVNRSWRLTVWQTIRQRRNPAVRWILLGAGSMLVAVLWVPALRHLFGFGPITVLRFGAAAAASIAGVLWFEVRKFVQSRGRPDGTETPRPTA